MYVWRVETSTGICMVDSALTPSLPKTVLFSTTSKPVLRYQHEGSSLLLYATLRARRGLNFGH